MKKIYLTLAITLLIAGGCTTVENTNDETLNELTLGSYLINASLDTEENQTISVIVQNPKQSDHGNGWIEGDFNLILTTSNGDILDKANLNDWLPTTSSNFVWGNAPSQHGFELIQNLGEGIVERFTLTLYSPSEDGIGVVKEKINFSVDGKIFFTD